MTWTGGPSQVDVVFTIKSVAIATINGTGLVEGIMPGNTTVTGQAQEIDPVTNDIVIFSEVYSNFLMCYDNHHDYRTLQ